MKQFKTRAKTAYGLLSEVRKLILEEPKRYHQNDLLSFKSIVESAISSRNSCVIERGGRNSLRRHEDSEYPACGTIGCVAGWVTVLSASRPSKIKDALNYARKVLGLSGDKQSDELFSSAAIGYSTNGQTPEHAALGAAHIAKFQAKYASQLKKRKL